MRLSDQVVNCHYNELVSYARFILNVAKKSIQHEVVISNAYIKAQKHEPKTLQEAKAILFHYIKAECLYTRTASQKEIITSVDFEDNQEAHEPEQGLIVDHFDIINCEVSSWNFIDRGFFQNYIDLKLNGGNVKDLAQMYGLDYTYTRKKIRNLKQIIKCKI